MMYIEHTNLEDNLHQILTNRVPTSSSPSANEASAASVATSALLARVREAQENSATSTLPQSFGGGQVSSTYAQNNHNSSTPNNNHQYQKFNKEWSSSRRPEPKLLPVEDLPKLENSKEFKRPPTPIPQPPPLIKAIQSKGGLESEPEEEPEEQYELLHVIDSDTVAEEEQTVSKEQEQVDNLAASSSHFVIELNKNNHKIADIDSEQRREEDDEFEYVVTRVPKRKSQYSERSHHSEVDTPSQKIHYTPELKRKVYRPVPEAIPIGPQLSSTPSYNGNLPVPQPPPLAPLAPPPSQQLRHSLRKHSIGSQDYYTHGELNGYASYAEDNDYADCDSDSETLEAALTGRSAACNSEYYNRQEDQMGLDILSRLKDFFTWNSSSNHYSTDHSEARRKRRSDGWSGETSSSDPHQFKYRKVESRFPKYIAAHREEDDISEFVQPKSYQQQQSQKINQKSTKYEQKYILNNSALNYNRTLLEMSNRRSTSAADKPPLRKSMFSAPRITQQLIKNNTYADVEFSDDDEPTLLKSFDINKPSTSAAVKHVPKVYNIPILRTDERLASMQQKPPPPALIEPRSGSILQSSLIPDLHSMRKPTYAEALRQCNPRQGATGTGHILGGRSSISSSVASTSESSRILNGLNNARTNHWSNQNRSSILDQEKESEEREKYQQLLEQVVPRLYGSTAGENKLFSANSLAQRRRSGLLMGAALTSSARSSPAGNRRSSIGLGQSALKRPPLSSTINLDVDDTEEEVTITGVSHLKTSRNNKIKQTLPSTVIIDDDELSDIVELGNEERHVLSACAKIQKEENSIVNLCEDKVEKLKKTPLPYVEPVNSLKERFSASPHMKENWLENLQSKFLQRKKIIHEEVKKAVNASEKTTADRRAVEADLQERLRKFQIVDPECLVVDDFDEIEEEPEFIDLSPQHRAAINAAMCGPPDQVLVSKFNLKITRRDIHTLCGHNWLNDEVINFYMNLLTERSEVKHDSHGLPKVYAMNTFFVPRLLQAGHAGVKRWTRKVDVFEKDIVPVPVHVGGVHWCMAIIHLKNRTIKYYDSMGTPNPNVLKALEQYLKEESLDKRKRPYDTSGFSIESVQGVPRQMNGSDCGVFSCMFAEYITRNREITFSQQNMEYFRQKMILEIVMGELLQ